MSITGLRSLEDRTGLWFTVKARPSTETDAQAKIQITEMDGLVRLLSTRPTARSQSMTKLTAASPFGCRRRQAAPLATGAAWRWDVQVAQPGPGVSTPRAGVCHGGGGCDEGGGVTGAHKDEAPGNWSPGASWHCGKVL